MMKSLIPELISITTGHNPAPIPSNIEFGEPSVVETDKITSCAFSSLARDSFCSLPRKRIVEDCNNEDLKFNSRLSRCGPSPIIVSVNGDLSLWSSIDKSNNLCTHLSCFTNLPK